MRLLRAIVLGAAIVLAGGLATAETAEPWREVPETGAVQHVPTDLRFPGSLGKLDREHYGAGTNPYTPGAVTVGYGSPDASGLLVTLIPVSSSAEESAQKLFAARVVLFRNQNPEIREIGAAKVAAECQGAGRGQLVGFELGIREEWFYATSVGDFIVYVRGTASDASAGGRVRGALTELLTVMGWPCAK